MAEEFNSYLDQFDRIFVGREREIKLLRYALLTRQHILLFGPPGTTKTKVCDVVFEGIVDAKTFSTEFTAFMTEAEVFGPYDVREMRDNGKMIHRIEDMLPEADYARLGELLDANPQVLRSMLSALNERRMKRGVQNIQMPLKTAYCDTNKDPRDYIRRYPDSFAVLDRILFIDQLDYITSAEDIGKMIDRFQRGVIGRAPKTISSQIIERLSSYVVQPPGLITDPTIITTMSRAVAEYCKKRSEMSDDDKRLFILPEISNRRQCFASRMLEAEAILGGRVEATIDDLLAAGVVLCTSEPERKLWDQIATDHIKKHQQEAATQTTTSQGIAIKGLLDQLNHEVINPPAGTPIKTIGQTFQVLSQHLAAIVPKDPAVRVLHEEARAKFIEAHAQLQQRVIAESGIGKLHI